MTRFAHALLISVCVASLCPGARAEEARVWMDRLGDATARPTDDGADDLFNQSALPDLVSASVAGWSMSSPGVDPFLGVAIDGDLAQLVRIDLVFAGLLNPPGPLGLGTAPFDPERFGDRPLYGFLEIDVDRDRDTGGEIGAAARQRYLANVGRFATRPHDSVGERMAMEGGEIDANFWTAPHYERSGAEFDFGFCGCSDIVLVSQSGDLDDVMDPGETFRVNGRFFRRIASAQSVSAMEGGSYGGLYDPVVTVQFSHDALSDRTTVSLVFPLTMAGAATLTGQPAEPADFLADNHVSVEEALWDLVDGALGINGPLSGELATLLDGWKSQQPGSSLDPTRWRVAALFGLAYTQQGEALYVWTDTGFDETRGDITGDAVSDADDEIAIADFIALRDGGPLDEDGTINGVVTLVAAALGFDMRDLDGDFDVDGADIAAMQALEPADFNGDGVVDGVDLAVVLSNWGGDGLADLNGDGAVDGVDLAAVLAAWG